MDISLKNTSLSFHAGKTTPLTVANLITTTANNAGAHIPTILLPDSLKTEPAHRATPPAPNQNRASSK